MNRPTVTSTETRFQGRVVGLRIHHLRMPNGAESEREVVTHLGAASS